MLQTITDTGPATDPDSRRILENHRTLVLNADCTPLGFPLHVMNGALTLRALHTGRVARVRDSNLVANGLEVTCLLPSVVRLVQQIPPGGLTGTAAFSRFGLYIRDRGLCQYGGHRVRYSKTAPAFEQGTIDHVLPRSRGGTDTWLNCVLACSELNNLKGDKMPHEFEMPLLTTPWVPTRMDLLSLWLTEATLDSVKPDWLEFLHVKPTPAVQRILEKCAA